MSRTVPTAQRDIVAGAIPGRPMATNARRAYIRTIRSIASTDQETVMMMNRTTLLQLAATFALAGAGAAFAAPPSATDAAQAAYKKQVESCNNGSSNEDRATCLKEAGAALAEARKGKLDEPNRNYKQNATERCDALTGDDHDACLARAKSRSIVSGSVESGGVLRETVTPVTPAPAPAPK